MTQYRVEYPDRSVLITDCLERAEQSARRFNGVVTVAPELSDEPVTILDDRFFDPTLERQHRLDQQWDEYCDNEDGWPYDDGTDRSPR